MLLIKCDRAHLSTKHFTVDLMCTTAISMLQDRDTAATLSAG